MSSTPVSWSKNRLIVVGILVSAANALLLLVIIPVFSTRLAPSYNQDRFADGYDYLAANLAEGHGYRFYSDTARTLMREPGYPILLAGLFLLFGKSLFAVKISNLVLALATAWLMTRLIRKLSDRLWPMLVAISLYLFHPGTLIAESRGGVEILFGFLVMLFVLTLYGAIEDNRAMSYLLSGLVLGVVLLVRSVLMLFPIFLLGYLLFFERQRASRIGACRNIAIMLLSMFAILSPWIVRNYSLTGKFVPTASVLGVSAQAGQYICTHLSEDKPWWLLDKEAGYERSRLAIALGFPFEDGPNGYYQTFYHTNDEIAFSKILVQQVLDSYKRSPMSFVTVLRRNLFNFWFAGKTQEATRANMLVQLPYLILASLGALIGRQDRQFRIVAPIVLLIGYVVAVHIPILAQARYSVPLIPFLSILGTIALVAISKKMARTEMSLEVSETQTARASGINC